MCNRTSGVRSFHSRPGMTDCYHPLQDAASISGRAFSAAPCLATILARRSGRKVHVDEGRSRWLADLVVLGDLAILQPHDRDGPRNIGGGVPLASGSNER